MAFAMSQPRPEPAGDPINAFFRKALLIGGEATRLYLGRHAQSQGNTGEDLATGDPDLTEVGWEHARRLPQRLSGQAAAPRAGGGGGAGRRRVQRVMDRIIKGCAGRRIAVVTHSGFIQTYVSLVL